MKKLTTFQYIACFLWVLILFSLLIYYVIFAPRDATFSDVENRMLAEMPAVNIENIFGTHENEQYERGAFSADFESYLVDRFPLRAKVITVSQDIRNIASIATYDDFIQFSQGQEDIISLNESDIPSQPDVSPSEQNDIETPEVTDEQTADTDDLSDTDETDIDDTTDTVDTKPEPNLADWPDTMGVYMQLDGNVTAQRQYSKSSIVRFAEYLDRFATLLPQDGQLAFIMVPQSVIGNRFLKAEQDDMMYSNFEEFIYAVTEDNVHAISATNILAEGLKLGQYVYFRSDMHWSSYGTYLVYAEAVKALGYTPSSWMDYKLTIEYPFLGTYHRDNPSEYFSSNPDSLGLYELPGNVIMQRGTGNGTFETVPLLDMNAAKNDRYTVFMGGPDDYAVLGAENLNGQKGSCLVITDSFGLSFVPLLTEQYEKVHYVDPRYYSRNNGTISELISENNITDCYVVVGDLHSFDNNFLSSAVNLID